MLKPMCVKQETLPTMSANPMLLPLKQGPHCVSKFGQGKILNVISKVQPQTVVKQEVTYHSFLNSSDVLLRVGFNKVINIEVGIYRKNWMRRLIFLKKLA